MKRNLKWVAVLAILVLSACQKLPSLGENFYGANYAAETLTWVFADGNGAEGINRDANYGAFIPRMASFNGKLYASWTEFNGVANQIRVKVMTGSAASPGWQFVDGGGVNGLNKDATKNAATPWMAVYANKLYITWYESDGTNTQVRASVYSGNDAAPVWTAIDGGGGIGFNIQMNKDAESPTLTVFNNLLYATWNEKGTGNVQQIRVRSYNGSVSTVVDGAGATGLNRNTAQEAQNPQLIAHNNRLFLFWYENSAAAQKNHIRVAVSDGAAPWTFADGNDPNFGLNKDAARAALHPIPFVFGGKLYVGWQEFSGNFSQIRVAVYTGNTSTTHSWAFVDGNGVNGINKDVSKDAVRFTPFVHNNKLYAAFSELNQSLISHIRVIAYNGNDSAPVWVFAEGTGADGLNKDKTREAIRPFTVVQNGELFLAWSEDNPAYKKSIRVISGK